MNDDQYKRYRRMIAEHIECLYYTHNKKRDIYFLIKGSQGVNYKVVVPVNGKVSCSCPDFEHNAKTLECVCKHCLHVLFNVLKVFDDVDHSFFTRCYLTPDEVRQSHDCYRELSKSSLKNSH